MQKVAIMIMLKILMACALMIILKTNKGLKINLDPKSKNAVTYHIITYTSIMKNVTEN